MAKGNNDSDENKDYRSHVTKEWQWSNKWNEELKKERDFFFFN